ncbi:MAG TPA: hypothetical protein PKC21_05990 [Oligoflexia bacterium]|nr:hypothetical protein [Oligoflexia bacterium]HMR24885.1 hypothetical protein [Oligoflexia bacterium]
MKHIFALALLFSSALLAKSSGFANFNLYPYDTRDLSVYTLELGINISSKLKYFSFTNFESQFGIDNEDIATFYSEQNVYWAMFNNTPLHFVGQWAIAGGSQNDTLRAGAGWNISQTKFLKDFFKTIHLSYTLNWYPLQLDSLPGYRWQIEHYYYWLLFPKQLSKRMYLSGFFDHNFSDNSTITVTEHQLGINFYKQLYVVAEYRYNGFLADKNGLGLGIEFKTSF